MPHKFTQSRIDKKLGLDPETAWKRWCEVTKQRTVLRGPLFRGYDYILSVLETRLGGLKGKKILEIGYGAHPRFMEILAKQGAEVTGVQPGAKQKEEKVRVVDAKVGEIGKHFKNNKFDAIFARNVFDVHGYAGDLRKDTPALLKTIRSKLRTGGVFIVQTMVTEAHIIPSAEFRAAGFLVLSSKGATGPVGHRIKTVVAIKKGK